MSDIKVYTTPACPWCHRVKDYLDEKGLIYEEIDVSKDSEEAERLVEKTGQMSVPVIEVGDKVIVGFDRDRLEEIL